MPVRNVLVDWGGQTLLNLGDLAMVMVATRRLAEIFPCARIQTTTHRPDDFLRFCPTTEPLLESAVQLLFWRRLIPSRLTRIAPGLDRLEDACMRRNPLTVLRLRARRFRRDPPMARAGRRIIESLRDADLVVAAGGGYLTDAFPGYVLRILGLLAAATYLGKPVVLLGQALGPLHNPALRARAREVFARARLITLREGTKGPALLRELGCLDGRVQVTGDDAIELVAAARSPEPAIGAHLGFNVRLSAYAATDTELWGTAALAVAKFARDRAILISACPIDCDPLGGDVASVRKVLGSGSPLDETPCPTSPAGVIDRVARCRLVVTGAYHAALFALAQGIPAICLARSEYYQEKFDGLKDQFGSGCVVVGLDQTGLSESLTKRLDLYWTQAPEFRAGTLAAADRQRSASRSAYETLPALVERPT